jgi:hypothetical protein
LVVVPPATLRVTVCDAHGAPWRGPLPPFWLVTSAGERVDAARRTDGHIVELCTVAGRYELELRSTDVLSQRQVVELDPTATCAVRLCVQLGRTRQLIFNGDGRDKPADGTELHVVVRRADGTVLPPPDQLYLLPDLRGFRYWTLSCAYPIGEYAVEAHTDTGLAYRAAFTVRDAVHDPVRIDVPFALR